MAVMEYWNKIKMLEALVKECADLRGSGKKIAFTNGCFDILHPGHARYLFEARLSADVLVVAVNSDSSVRTLKGRGRPILPERARAELLAALGFVDAVVIFEEETPLKVIRKLLPDVLVKGSDWAEKDIVGADEVRAAGGEIRRIPVIAGFSSSSIIERIAGSSEKI